MAIFSEVNKNLTADINKLTNEFLTAWKKILNDISVDEDPYTHWTNADHKVGFPYDEVIGMSDYVLYRSAKSWMLLDVGDPTGKQRLVTSALADDPHCLSKILCKFLGEFHY